MILINYLIIGFLISLTKIRTLEGKDMFESLSTNERINYFVETTIFWPRFILFNND